MDDLTVITEKLKELAKEERELGLESWVRGHIEGKNWKTGERINFQRFDYPRWIYEKREWVIHWRCAMFKCKNPRLSFSVPVEYYSRSAGGYEYTKLLKSIASRKAQVTLQKRRIKEYIDMQKHNNLFFNELEDGQLKKINKKLRKKERELTVMQVAAYFKLKKNKSWKQKNLIALSLITMR